MTRVIGIHDVELKAGVEPGDFDRYLSNELWQLPVIPGARVRFLRRGNKQSQRAYRMLVEIDAVLTHDGLLPSSVASGREVDRWLTAHAPMWERFRNMAEIHWTDYVEIGT